MGAHAVHSLPQVRKLLEAAKRKYPDGIPPAVRKAIFKDPAAVELAQAAVALNLVAGTAPEPFSTSKTSNWVARAGGLPTLIQHVAHDLMDKGKLSESRAIGMAVGIVKNWAHGHDGKGHAVSPQVVAEAVKAIAEWDAKRAKAHVSHSNMSRRFARVVELARYAIFGPTDLTATSAADLSR
jgi:hypothetical protein